MDLQNLYSDLIIIELSILLTIGIGALLLKLPQRQIYANYRVALRFYGAIVLLWTCCLSILSITRWQGVDYIIGRAAIISVSYIIIRLFAAALCYLLKIKVPSKMSTIIARWMVVNAILLFFILNMGEQWARVAIHVVNIIAAIDAIAFGVHFHKIYRSRIEEIDNYYSEDVNSYFKWMRKETICVILWLVVGYVTEPFNQPPITIHSLMGFLILVRLAFCFRGYLADLHHIKYAISGDEVKASPVIYPSAKEGVLDNITVIQRVGKLVIKQMNETNPTGSNNDSDSHIDRLEVQVKGWIERRGYLEPMINIESLALDLGTNRAYLSSYINKRYGVNFRNWVAGLRVEYSKQLLIEQQHLSIAQIAEMLNYTQSSYSTIFKKHYGVSVSQWRVAALNS